MEDRIERGVAAVVQAAHVAAFQGRTAAAPRRRLRRSRTPLEQLALELGSPRPRWTFSRLVLRSPYRDRIRERLEFVRGFFPELDALTVRVGLARKRGVLGWGSLDPEAPGVWVRPRRVDAFTVAHEFTHLLQAMKLVPLGERACDLWALARSPLLVDAPPGYLRIPRPLRRASTLAPFWSAMLHRAACEAIAARGDGDRRYLLRFERAVAEAWRRHRDASTNGHA
jgi:hypothetical protein